MCYIESVEFDLLFLVSNILQNQIPCKFEGYATEEGFYLSADTRYTDSIYDIWIDYNDPIDGILEKSNIRELSYE